MALNFPQDTSAPYIDATSGIKYVYNTSVGAWEAAIQPPTIVSDDQPGLAIDGFLWWDSDDEILYVYQGGSWRPAGGNTESSAVTVSSDPPLLPATGDLWWDSIGGVLYIYYTDPDGGTFWTPASPPISGESSGGVTSSTTQPTEAQEGDLWLNTSTSVLYVYHSNTWVSTQPPATGVQSVSGTAPITVTGTASDPIVDINTATDSTTGVVQLATQSEVNAGTDTTKVVTPATLKTVVENSTHTPAASETVAGIVELATDAEAVAGTDTQRAVTPAGLAAKLATIGGGIPAGTVVPFAGSTVPADYLECDGSAVDRTTYAALYAAIGDLYGAGDGSTTFNLPDLRGEFVRGWDNGRGVDSGRSFGTTQNSDNKSHTHTATVNDSGHFHGPWQSGGQAGGGTGYPVGSGNIDTTNPRQVSVPPATTGITVSNSTEGGTEARPRNIALLYCIKF